MKIIEFPKAVYRDGVYLAVADEAEEAAARDDGFTDWHSDHAKLNGDPSSADHQVGEPSRDEMKVAATALGITFKHNISNVALAALVAAGKD